jgi:multiple sugar transport system ATP-binding protein
MALVGLRGLRKAFGDREVLHGIDAEIAAGEFAVILGPSGSGKTTLLRVVAGLETPSAGRIELDGRVVNALAPKERDMAMVFQQYALYPHMTVRENLGFSLKMRDESAARIAERVAEAAEILGLAALLERYPSELSGGQQQRVAIGRAIVRKPRLFLFDEPLSNLDGSLRAQMRTELKSLQRRLGTTSLYVTHDQTEAMAMADRVIVLREGRVEQAGSPLEVYDRPANLFVAGFIGLPAMNLVAGRVRGNGVEAADGTRLPLGRPLAEGRQVVYGFRPEACAIGSEGVSARISLVEQMGASVHVYCQVAGVSVCAVSGERRDWRPGQAIRLRPDPARVQLFDAASGAAL